MALVEQSVAGCAVVPAAYVQATVERTKAASNVAESEGVELASLQLDDLPTTDATFLRELLLGQASAMTKKAK